MRRAALLVALVSLGCWSTDTHPDIAGLALKVMPVSGGTNYVEFDTTGFVRGGRISGDSAPVVHEDTARITPAEAHDLFARAMALGDTILRYDPTPPDEPRGSQVLAILFQNGSQVRIVWPVGRDPADPGVKALVQQMLSHKVGGW